MDKCKLFLETYKTFEWFIIHYYGESRLNKLIQLAKDNKEAELIYICESIWFDLPDDRFNLRENPKGWCEFLNIAER